MLRIDLGALRHGPIDVAQTVPGDDPLFESLEFDLNDAVELTGRLMEAGAGRYYWHGSLRARAKGSCRRCLADVDAAIDQSIDVLFIEDASAEDPAAYAIPPRATELDLSEAVREELILAAPEFVLCDEQCRGLCPQCGTDLNTGTCACRPERDPRWASLEALKTTLPDNEDH